MRDENKNIRVDLPNFLLVAGNGRNVGKTWFSCQVIKHLSRNCEVSAIKVSAHIHPYNQNDAIFIDENFVVLEEKNISTKDSSLMLQAGAEKVYFIMASQKYLEKAFLKLKPFLPSHAIVCESGGLHEFIQPGLFFFVNTPKKEITKRHHLKYAPIYIENNGISIDFDIETIAYSNHKISIQR